MDKCIDDASFQCPQCASLRTIPKHLVEQTTESPPSAIGIKFAADVLKRERQLVLILREYVTSYVQATIITSEKHDALRDALLQLTVTLKPTTGPPSIIRVDPAPGFQALVEDRILHEHNIAVEIGRHKNLNKNPVAERAVQEVENEIARSHSHKPVSAVDLALICDRVNSKLQ